MPCPRTESPGHLETATTRGTERLACRLVDVGSDLYAAAVDPHERGGDMVDEHRHAVASKRESTPAPSRPLMESAASRGAWLEAGGSVEAGRIAASSL